MEDEAIQLFESLLEHGVVSLRKKLKNAAHVFSMNSKSPKASKTPPQKVLQTH